MASVQFKVDWQSTKDTILERNRHMFNNPDMSDISFTCESSDKIFYAHKYVLSTSSAVFHAMFYGGLAVKDSQIDLSDTNKGSLEQFLRFLYTEECTLDSDNVVAVLYLAKKYIVPSLSKKCVDFLGENLNAENVLSVLEQAVRFDEKEFEAQCWKVVQSNADKVVTSDSFNNISQMTLAKLLKQDVLDVPEINLFQAVLKWIDFQCSLKKLKPTGENRRNIIGEAIYYFRFFSMTNAEFAVNVSKTGILSPEELVPIYEKFLGIDSPELKWKLPNRTTKRSKPNTRFPRFPKGSESNGWNYTTEPDRLCFSVKKDAFLLGVRLFGDEKKSEYEATFEVKNSKVTGTFTSETNQDGIPGFDVMLNERVALKKDEVVTLSAKINGAKSFYGSSGFSFVTLDGVSVTFINAPSPNNGTSITGGQFHEIILSI
ncbi:BTB/POZ domain-containing protein 6-B-like [Dendronephthya gigantea]|uniref:BTB/POZ domain-containing protein 6-B-like n=1 Tax=Dendronephthya gigantea TaxID=151771 RepID=UPI00106D665A|nr:BTB/POZ domain-containing protein 6-B-like [Dendronephthya gigantea]